MGQTNALRVLWPQSPQNLFAQPVWPDRILNGGEAHYCYNLPRTDALKLARIYQK